MRRASFIFHWIRKIRERSIINLYLCAKDSPPVYIARWISQRITRHGFLSFPFMDTLVPMGAQKASPSSRVSRCRKERYNVGSRWLMSRSRKIRPTEVSSRFLLYAYSYVGHREERRRREKEVSTSWKSRPSKNVVAALINVRGV